jgi:hypothetical protein
VNAVTQINQVIEYVFEDHPIGTRLRNGEHTNGHISEKK